jgi:hypothetical protein
MMCTDYLFLVSKRIYRFVVDSYFSRCALLALLTAVGGCGTPETKAPNVNLAGYPPVFRAGYVDGCNSARRPDNLKKDEERFKREPQYAAGWRDGHDICLRK